jgi:hypothetical protein
MYSLLIGRRVRVTTALLLGITMIVSSAHAEVDLRVESHPIAAPIDAFVRGDGDR